MTSNKQSSHMDILPNNNIGNTGTTRVRTISGGDRHDNTVSSTSPKQFADRINRKDTIKNTEGEKTSNQMNKPTTNNDSLQVELSHGNSHPQFHTGTYLPISAADLTLEVHKSSQRKYIQREHSTDSNNGSSHEGAIPPIIYKQAVVMSLWFFLSFSTIVLNKYLLSTLNVDASVLGECQILMTTFFGGIMMYLPWCRLFSNSKRNKHENFNRYQFYKTISILGWLRCGAVICSVIGLKYVAVSFSETIKSSAPLFTAIMAYFMLGEYSGIYVNLSLIPIMFGLALSTYTEISFNLTGFLAACSNNILDCIQNVFSKKLLSDGEINYSPLELQFYTSVAATVVQMPLLFFFVDVSDKFTNIDSYVSYMLVLNGVMFYLQSLFAYSLMSLISPVTFSVSNTVKRAGLIWFSILVFGNKITLLNAFGTFCVVSGVFLYQRARIVEADKRKAKLSSRSKEKLTV